jgi:hypothetical protein
MIEKNIPTGYIERKDMKTSRYFAIVVDNNGERRIYTRASSRTEAIEIICKTANVFEKDIQFVGIVPSRKELERAKRDIASM